MKRRILCFLLVPTPLATFLAAPALHGLAVEAAPQAPAADPQPPLTFRVEANFVEVDAFVSDAMGNPVTDLGATDFQLFEDGKPQKVSAFSHVHIPVTRPERPLFSPSAIEPDVQT